MILSVSAALLAANEILLARRQNAGLGHAPNRQPEKDTIPWSAAPQSLAEQILAQPEHLGWGSAAVTRAIRRTRGANSQPTHSFASPSTPMARPAPYTQAEPRGRIHGSVTLLPDLAFGLLKHHLASQGRLWLLLRHLDKWGRGWHEQGAIRKQLLTGDLRFCGRRQLANLLKEGEGIFWRFARGRIWLFSAGRVASHLDVAHGHYRPVALPLKALTGSVGTVRAHLYATYHSARAGEKSLGMPVARETIAHITGVDPHSQRAYEKRLHLEVRHNIAIGEEYVAGAQGQALTQERAWRHGRALFTLTDYQGKQGPKGRQYHAWQLPNSYGAIHTAESRGKRRRLNRQLIVLQKKGAGNDQVARRYFANGRQMERSHNERHIDSYCQTGRYSAGCTWSVFSENMS